MLEASWNHLNRDSWYGWMPLDLDIFGPIHCRPEASWLACQLGGSGLNCDHGSSYIILT